MKDWTVWLIAGSLFLSMFAGLAVYITFWVALANAIASR